MASVYERRTTAARLRPGPGALPRGHVTEIQRSRMISAAIEAVEEVGYARMTVAQVIGRARVSRKTFYDVFLDREDCFLAAFEQSVGQARRAVLEAYESGARWRDGVRAGLARMLTLMDEEPGIARLCVVEALGAGERVLEARARLLDELAAVIDRGRIDAHSARDPSELTAEGVVGAVFAVLHTRLLDDGARPLSELLGSLMSMIVLPYLGTRAASRELTVAPAPAPASGRAPASVRATDPLDGLNMRLTYRTVRVLAVIGERPGASNREIAESSGIIDQGQISKLLNRLARLSLIDNLGGGQERGASNAWHLTPRGAQIERATRPR
jgi:AcrR family transcriptional regulator